MPHKLIEFFGMQRSGTHAIIEWIFYNICGESMPIRRQVVIGGRTRTLCQDSSGKTFFFNDLSVDNKEDALSHVLGACSSDPVVIFLYENKPVNDIDKQYVIIRDFINNLCSRIKAIQNLIKPVDASLIINSNEFYNSFIDLWINYATYAEHINAIVYNRWLTEKSYRDEKSGMFGYHNLDKIVHSKFGDGSSFKDHADRGHLERFKMKNIPGTGINIIKTYRFDELCEINKKSFDLDLRRIL